MLSTFRQSPKRRQIQISFQLARPMTSIAILPENRADVMEVTNFFPRLVGR
ncbi:MAG TPA: hypothetical protein VGH90_09150 [Chthoniobacteraceae bacterium]